jgi:uncharacterized membrane protein YedE/YeeE
MKSGPDPERLLVSWVRLVQARWAATGVPRRDRDLLLQQLLRELATARAAGAHVEELIDTPPAVFADSCATGLGLRHRPIGTAGLLTVCLGTGVVATGAAWWLLLSLSRDPAVPTGFDEGVFYLLTDLALIAAVLTTMVMMVHWTYRHHAEVSTLTPRLAVTLIAATVVGFPLASLYGSGHGYSWSRTVIATEALIVLFFLALGTLWAQRWASLRRKAGQPGLRGAAL